MYLEDAPKKALELFLKLGTFIRESLLIPTASKEALKNLYCLKPLEFVRSLVVPLSFETFKDKTDLVIGVVVEHGNEAVYDDLKLEGGQLTPQQILRFIIKNNVIAFIINAEYDSELGLRFDKYD